MSRVFAVIDIGTNSIRMAVVREEEDHRLTTLAVHREVARLGEGEFETNHMTQDAIARGALICSKFAEVARGFGAEEITAFATSAAREAENRDDFVDRVREMADIEVRVISGPEEARLIWLGVSSGIELSDRRAVLMDIGGGSTEVVVGDASGYRMLDSLKLGSIRLSNKFLTDDKPVSAEKFAIIQEHVRGVASQVTRRVREHGFDLAMGSAGTITTLADVTGRRLGEQPFSSQRTPEVRFSDLRETIQILCRLSVEDRKRVPGMDPSRADIIIGGAAVIQTLMELFGADRLSVSDRGLRDGILLNEVLGKDDARESFQAAGVRRRSIMQLAHACNFEAEHAQHTAFLARRLFDELRRLNAHHYGEKEAELLEYAALTHDIGMFLSHSNHQKHAYYLVRNSDLLGFNDTEIDVIANVALYHRKGIPKKRHENLAGLNRSERRRVSVLAAILRIAEGLDRGHLGLVKNVQVIEQHRPHQFVLTLFSDSDCQLEVWGVQNNTDLFEYVFNASLIAEVEPLRTTVP